MPRLPNLVRLHREGRSAELYTALYTLAHALVRTSGLQPGEWDDAASYLVSAAYEVVTSASNEGLEGVVKLHMHHRLSNYRRESLVLRDHETTVPTLPERDSTPSAEDVYVEEVTRHERQTHARELVSALFTADWLTPKEKQVLEDLYTYGEDGAAERLGVSQSTLRSHRQSIRNKMSERGLTPNEVVHGG